MCSISTRSIAWTRFRIVTRTLGIPMEEAIADRLQLEQQLLEPELVRLVDHDEQELVVDGGIREELLERQELGELEVTAVGEEVDLDFVRFFARPAEPALPRLRHRLSLAKDPRTYP